MEGLTSSHERFPKWLEPMAATLTQDRFTGPDWIFERKYDGIRLMLHKSMDARGSVLCGAYTRNRHDWMELVPGLDATIRMFPALSDGDVLLRLVLTTIVTLVLAHLVFTWADRTARRKGLIDMETNW